MNLFFYLILLYYTIIPAGSWCLRTIFASSHKIRSVDFSPDGEYIVTGSSTGKVLLWKTDTLEILKVYNFPVQVWEATFSKDQLYIAIGGAQNIIHIINALTFVQIRTIDTAHDNIVFDLDFQYDSQALITCGDDSKTKIWKVSDGSNIMTKSNKHETYTCQFADDNKFAVAGRHYYQTFNAAGTLVHQFHDGDYDDFYGLSIRPGSLYFIATNGNGDLFEADWAGTNIFHRDGVGGLFACAYSRDATYFATGGQDGNIYMYNATNRVNKLQAILRTNSTSSINSTKFSYDSNYFLAGNENGSVYFYQRFCHGCPTGSYPNITTCRLCASDLVGCSICINSTVCKTCQSGYYIDNTNKVCKSCDTIEGCGNCASATNCTSCLQGWFVSGLICARCAAIIPGCYQCKSNTECFQCQSTYYVNNGLCSNCTTLPHCLYCNNATGCFTCVAGYSPVNGTCVNCSTSIANCLICQNGSYCLSCQSGYRVNSTYLCQKCGLGCLFCNNTSHCFDCAEGLYLTTSFVCDLCVYPCLSCNSTTYCKTCVPGSYLSAAGVCTVCGAGCLSCNTTTRCQGCDVGYYLDTGTRTCKNCSLLTPNCRQCTATTCLVCQLEYHMNSTSCAQCSSLIANCQICASDTVCQHCMTGFYATGLNGSSSCQVCDQVGCSSCKSSTQCYACKPGYYISGQDCIICANNCLTCTSGLATACSSCIEGFYLSSTTTGTCLGCSAISKCTACLNSTYCLGCAIGFFLSSPTACTACTRPCITCKTSATDCLTCDLGFYLSVSGGGLGSCSACTSACSECSTSSTTCLNCVQGYYLNSTSSVCTTCTTTLPGCSICDSDTTCILCASGYYPSNGSCLACGNAISKCLTCDTVGSTCLQCSYGFSLTSTNTSCLACQISIPNCEHCTSNSSCQTCQNGFFYNAGSCSSCNTGCLICVNTSYCESCASSYTLLSTKVCTLCQDAMIGCQLCSSNTVCTDCVVGYYLNGSTCYVCRFALEGCEYCSDSSHCVQCSLFYQLQSNGTCKVCSSVYTGCQACANSTVGCTECKMSYFLDSSGTCQSCSNITSEGCLKCTSNATCTECMAGYHLSTTTSLCIRCEITHPDCIYCSETACLQCQSGYYLNNGTCSLCNNLGCQICQQSDPTKCITCNSRYYLSATNSCNLCSTSMPQCLSCLTSSICLECATGFYVTASQTCNLCSNEFPGCSICSPSGCIDCMTNFFLNSTDLHCHNCTDHITGCAFCLSPTSCISCQAGYYSINNTCAHCSQIPGCLYCINSSICKTCEQSYFLSTTDNSCHKCLDNINFCYACDDNSTCISCIGQYQLLGGVCTEVKGQAVKKYKQIGLKSYYVNDTCLKHTLFARAFKFTQIDQDWPNAAQLTLISHNYTIYLLTILKVQWAAGSYQLNFYTNNPIADQLSQSMKNMPFIKANRRLLQDSSMDLGFHLKLMLNQQATQDIMPQLGHIGDLYLDYPYSDSSFYQSYLKNHSYSYYIFGLVITILLLFGYFIKLCWLLPQTKDRGNIIPHIFAIKCCALALYPTYGQYISFCYGFMTADIPWMNVSLGGKMGNIHDITPDPFKMYYTNLSLVSTYFIALIVIFILWFCLGFVGFVCEDSRRNIEALKGFLYNFFGFGVVLAGCLALQGTIYNPLDSPNVNTVFYIIGIIIYLGIFVEIVYSFFLSRNPIKTKAKTKSQAAQEDDIGKGGHLRKLRFFIKASLLSITHLAPLYFISAIFCVEVGWIFLQYYLAQDEKTNPKLELVQHMLANLALLLMILIPDALIGIVITIVLISLTILILIYRNFCEIRQTSSLQGLQIEGKPTFFNSQATQFDFFNAQKKNNAVDETNKRDQFGKKKKNTSRIWYNKDPSFDESILSQKQ